MLTLELLDLLLHAVEGSVVGGIDLFLFAAGFGDGVVNRSEQLEVCGRQSDGGQHRARVAGSQLGHFVKL